MHWNERLSTLVSYTLVAGMMTCVAFTIVQIGQIVWPGWDGGYIIFVAFFLSLVFMFGQRYLRRERLSFPDTEWFLYHFTEWVVILLATRALLYARVGVEQIWVDITSGREMFITRFFTNEYLLTIFVLVIFWLLSRIFADELYGMEGDEKLLKMEMDSGVSTERKLIRQRMVNLIFFIGGALVVLTSLLRKDIQTRLGFSSSNEIAVYNVLVYFLLGFILLSLSQFSILRARWGLDRIPVNKNLVGRWVIFSFLFLSGLILLSAILPTGYTLNLLSVLRQLASFIGLILSLIIAILSLPLVLIAALLSWIVGGEISLDAAMLVPQTPGLPVIPSPPSWIEFIKSVFFWVSFFGVIVFSVYYYFQLNWKKLNWLRRFKFINLILSFWTWVQAQIWGISRAISSAVRSGIERVIHPEKISLPARPWNFINQRKLTPRQRILFFYMLMLRRGDKSGIPRRVGETPYEYAQSLSSKIDTLELEERPVIEVGTLTEKFIEARYSTHEIDMENVSVVRLAWDRIRRVLQQIRRKKG